MSIDPVDIYEVKRSQRHLFATFKNNRLGAPNISKMLKLLQSKMHLKTFYVVI